MKSREVEIPVADATLRGDLQGVGDESALVIFAHGSGGGRLSPRNRAVAAAIRAAGIGTLLFDLLTEEEEIVDSQTAELRFDIPLLARRLEAVTEWVVARHLDEHGLAVGYFGASTGAAAALIAASRLGERIGAVVLRGGRPDLAGPFLEHVVTPTLLVVGQRDPEVIVLNERAHLQLTCERDIAIVPRAGHLFEEPGALEEVARLAIDWFHRHLAIASAAPTAMRRRSLRGHGRMPPG
jgi:pimeloyl-ACP methyl ester carboxylesterase